MNPTEKAARKDVAARIKYWRKSRGLNSTELSKILGNSKQTVSRWQKGKSMPPLLAIYQISKLCGISMEEFYSKK